MKNAAARAITLCTGKIISPKMSPQIVKGFLGRIRRINQYDVQIIGVLKAAIVGLTCS